MANRWQWRWLFDNNGRPIGGQWQRWLGKCGKDKTKRKEKREREGGVKEKEREEE